MPHHPTRSHIGPHRYARRNDLAPLPAPIQAALDTGAHIRELATAVMRAKLAGLDPTDPATAARCVDTGLADAA